MTSTASTSKAFNKVAIAQAEISAWIVAFERFVTACIVQFGATMTTWIPALSLREPVSASGAGFRGSVDHRTGLDNVPGAGGHVGYQGGGRFYQCNLLFGGLCTHDSERLIVERRLSTSEKAPGRLTSDQCSFRPGLATWYISVAIWSKSA